MEGMGSGDSNIIVDVVTPLPVRSRPDGTGMRSRHLALRALMYSHNSPWCHGSSTRGPSAGEFPILLPVTPPPGYFDDLLLSRPSVKPERSKKSWLLRHILIFA